MTLPHASIGAVPPPSVGEMIGRVVEDGKAVARAEVKVWQAIVAWRASGLKLGVPLLVAALFMVQAVLTALLVGMIFVLAPLIGAGWATLLVIVVGLGVTGVLVWAGLRSCRSLFVPLPGDAA